MKGSTKFRLMSVILTLIALFFVGVCVTCLMKGNVSGAIASAIIFATLSVFFTVLLKKAYTDMKTGVPSEDEREKKVRMYAAGYAYFISLCLWLGIMFVKDYLSSEQMITAGVSGMAVIFAISWWCMSHRGDAA
jgi:L-asparagine transporter-like permease